MLTKKSFNMLSILAVVIMGGCTGGATSGPIVTTRQSASGYEIETTVDYSWNTDSKAVADKIHNSAWGHASIAPGDDVVVRLFRKDFTIGTFDGQSYYEIVFQLPANYNKGQPIPLVSIPKDRDTIMAGEFSELANMEPGEITAFKFGNPMMGWMKSNGGIDASVTIHEVDRRKARFRLRLKAKLDPRFDFDIDDEFTARVVMIDPDNKSLHETR